jgi:hypothetical protein
VDNQRAWFNAGLTRPDLPKITVGYEYQSRAGTESTLNWAQYSPDPTDPAIVPKAVLPAYRDTSATTQIIKLDLSYEPGGYLLEDSFRGEFYNLNQSANTRSGYFFVDGFAGQSEQYSHFQAANAFRVGKQVNSWCYVSGGYLYTHVDGDESFERAAGSLVTAPAIDAAEQAPSVAVEQHSNTINANVLLGPWVGLSVVVGA